MDSEVSVNFAKTIREKSNDPRFTIPLSFIYIKVKGLISIQKQYNRSSDEPFILNGLLVFRPHVKATV